MNIEEAVSKLESILNYSFENKALLGEALTHSSYANERKINKVHCNERLEFLGDAVLEMISSEYLFDKYPDMEEGKLSKLRASLVCEPALYVSSKRIGLGELILLGKGEEQSGGRERPSITSDAFEAVLGALFIDGGIEEARKLVMEHVLYDTDSFIEIKDPKSLLQEMIQSKCHNAKIEYRLTDATGPEHSKVFTVTVYINDKECGSGQGTNKKIAEKNAAREAVKSLGSEGVCI